MWQSSLVRQYVFDLSTMSDLDWKKGITEDQQEKLLDIIFESYDK
jgi:hypothetical protein